MRTLVVLIACCGVILWALRRLRDNSDPVLVEARAIQDQAIGALRSGKPGERLTAIHELERLSHADRTITIPPLIEALKDPDIEVRMAAVQALSAIGPSVVKSRSRKESVYAATSALIGCLNDADAKSRTAAVQALGSIGSSLVEFGFGETTVATAASALIKRLKDPEPKVRSAASVSLGKIASPLLKPAAGPPISRAAILDSLAGMLSDRDAKVRLAAINAIASYPLATEAPPALAEGLKDESAENRAAVVIGLNFRRQGLDPWLPLLLHLVGHDPDPMVRGHCMNTLSFAFKPPAVTPAIVPTLIAGLKSDNVKVRSQSASILSGLRADARAAIPELLKVLNEPLDPRVVSVVGPAGTFDPGCAAVQALGRIAPGSSESKTVIAALIEVALEGPESRRGWAAVALGEFGPAAAEAAPVLINLLKDATDDDKFEHASSSAWALGRIAPDTPSAGPAAMALLPLLESKASLARVKAIEALSQFGPKAAAAIPKLLALKNDRDAEVRNAAAKALGRMENESVP
jgi:HEAT repeat protein